MKQVIGSTWPSERPMCTSCVFMYLHIVTSVWTIRALVMLYLVWRCLFLWRLVASSLLTMTKTSKTFDLLLCSPQDAQYQKCMKMSDCEMLKMNSYINIKCCSDDLCNTFDESAWWPPGDAVHWSPVVAPQPTWAADEWRSTFNEDKPALSKNWTNKTIEKRSLWCLWMHCDCLGMVWHGFTLGQATDKSLEIHGCGLVSSVRYKADNLRFITRMTLLTDARDSKWCWKKNSITVIEFSN